MPETEEDVPSPCIQVCALDPATATCLGCWRTIDEIAAWGTLSAREKRVVLARVRERRAAVSVARQPK